MWRGKKELVDPEVSFFRSNHGCKDSWETKLTNFAVLTTISEYFLYRAATKRALHSCK
jgi:hypothetical protein